MDGPEQELCDLWPLCDRKHFWKNSVLCNPSWNNLSIDLLWLRSFRTNINVLQIMLVPVQIKFCIGQSTHHCQLEQALLLGNNTHLKSRPRHGTSYLLNADHGCEQNRCGNTATARFTLQAGKDSGGSLWPNCAEIQRPYGHLYQLVLKMSFAVSD